MLSGLGSGKIGISEMVVTYCEYCGDELELPKVGQQSYFIYCPKCRKFQQIIKREVKSERENTENGDRDKRR